MTVIASPGQGPDRSTEVSYTDTKEICFTCLNKKKGSGDSCHFLVSGSLPPFHGNIQFGWV